MKLSELAALFPGQDPEVMAWDEHLEVPRFALLVEHHADGILRDEHGTAIPYVVIAVDENEDEED